MTREEWQRIKTVSAAALERPESERPDYIAAQCNGDPAFEREVTSLVSFSARASNLFETNSFALPAAAADIMSPASGPTSSGLLARLEGGAPRRFHPGDLVNGRYSVESLAGEGGMGAVYRVVDTATGRTLALKTIGGRVRSVNLFKIEFRTLVELAHPHLARSYDFEPIAGGDDYFFTMDFVDGASIYDATTAAPWRRVVELVVQLCRALAYVHNRGVTHRDLKPNNVLVQRDGVVKLVDFGLAGIDDDLKDAIGTPSYLAPEVRAANRGDHRADLYSLGILTYQLLTRRLPFTGADLDELLRQHAYAPVIWPDRVELPTWLKEIVTKLCAKQPSDRFRGANQVIESLNERGGLDYPVETAATRDSYVLSGRFVGRQAELDALSAFVTGRLAAGSGDSNPMAFVAGASGVGKSRLMRELRHRLQLDRQTFVETHCFEGAAAEYGALAEAIAQLVPIAEACGGFDITGRYLGHLVKIAPDVERRGVAPAPALATPEAERARLFDAIAGFLIELSSRRPFVLFVDDAQWAPHGTVEILAYVRRRIVLAEQRGDHVRLALVAAYRDEEAAGRPIESLVNEARSGARTLGLEPLRPEAMERLLVSMFGLDYVPRAFVSRVLDEAAGSPFFLEEVVRGLVENGSVFVDGGEWRTASELGALEIPATVIAALRRRLAMIDSAEAFDVLRLLAVHKKPMSAQLLAAVAGRPAHAIDEELYELSRRHMIVAVDASERLFRTVHDYLRTTVYDDLGDDVRGVHLRIATGLERAADAGNPRLSELAHHYWAGGDRDQALKYSLLAGRSALKMYANDEAIEYLERALDLLPPEQAEVRAETVEQLADACFLAGRYHRAETLLTQLGGDAAAALDRVRIQRKRAELVGYSAGTPGKAVDILWDAARQLGARRPSRAMFVPRTVTALARHFAQRSTSAAIPRARDDGERRRLAELAATYLRIGYFSFFSDPVLLVLPVTRAANLVDRIPDSEEYSRVYAMMAITVAGLGLEARALRYGREAIEQATRSGSPLQVANARSFHALVLLQTGHWAEALDHAERACSSFAAAGDHFQLAVSAVAMIEVLHERGDLAAARARAQEQVAVFDRLELQMIGKGLYTVYGRVLAKTGDPEGIAVGRRVLALAEQGSDTLSTVFAEVALGDSLLELGREDEAIEHLERGLSIRDRDGFDVYVVAQGSALLARAYAAQVRRANARLTGAVRRTFERRVRQAVRVGRRFAPMRSAACLSRGLSCTLSGRHQEAMRWFEDAARLASALGARVWEADAHFENGLAILAHEGGRSRRARAELSLAQSLYSSCGAVPGEQRATDALAGLAGAATV